MSNRLVKRLGRLIGSVDDADVMRQFLTHNFQLAGLFLPRRGGCTPDDLRRHLREPNKAALLLPSIAANLVGQGQGRHAVDIFRDSGRLIQAVYLQKRRTTRKLDTRSSARGATRSLRQTGKVLMRMGRHDHGLVVRIASEVLGGELHRSVEPQTLLSRLGFGRKPLIPSLVAR